MGEEKKYSYYWFYNMVFGEEAIRPRFYEDSNALPSTLRAARSLESGMPLHAQSRSALFVKQGKLLSAYEDDFIHDEPVVRYFPTYQSLTNPELRGYFTWRTALRRGVLQHTHLSYAFLYIYELLNMIGPKTPEDGYRQLLDFQKNYGALDAKILPYLNRWLADYIVYYQLDPVLLADTHDVLIHNSAAVFASLPDRTDEQILDALKMLVPGWLSRSKFYRNNTADMDIILVQVLRKAYAHYASGKYPMVEQFFGRRVVSPLRLFDGAVFHNRIKNAGFTYCPDNSRIFRYKNGSWSVEQYSQNPLCIQRLEDLVKTVDAIMRLRWGSKHPIKQPASPKWLTNAIEAAIEALLTARKAEIAAREAAKIREQNRIQFNFSQLDAIRRDAEVTRDKLIVAEEEEEECTPEIACSEPTTPAPEVAGSPAETSDPPGCPLPSREYRLLQCLLYGRPLDWIRQEGLMLSVLTDSINDILFDTFSDTVLASDDPPELIEDYIDDLKAMVKP